MGLQSIVYLCKVANIELSKTFGYIQGNSLSFKIGFLIKYYRKKFQNI